MWFRGPISVCFLATFLCCLSLMVMYFVLHEAFSFWDLSFYLMYSFLLAGINAFFGRLYRRHHQSRRSMFLGRMIAGAAVALLVTLTLYPIIFISTWSIFIFFAVLPACIAGQLGYLFAEEKLWDAHGPEYSLVRVMQRVGFAAVLFSFIVCLFTLSYERVTLCAAIYTESTEPLAVRGITELAPKLPELGLLSSVFNQGVITLGGCGAAGSGPGWLGYFFDEQRMLFVARNPIQEQVEVLFPNAGQLRIAYEEADGAWKTYPPLTPSPGQVASIEPAVSWVRHLGDGRTEYIGHIRDTNCCVHDGGSCWHCIGWPSDPPDQRFIDPADRASLNRKFTELIAEEGTEGPSVLLQHHSSSSHNPGN